MDRLVLDPAELRQVNDVLAEFEDEFDTLDLEDALQQATVLAHHLPSRIRVYLEAFRRERLPGVVCISGYQVDDDRLGPTPAHWRDRQRRSPARREELLLVMYGSLLGDPFGWATQQDGRLIHDVLPIKGHENEQLGSSSEALLTWHTEDAFHPLRGDFLAFACLRNPYGAATTVGYGETLPLPAEVRKILFEERFIIHPDESHLAKNNSVPTLGSFEDIDQMNRNPDRVAVLFGDPDKPYIRADPYFMAVGDGDDEGQQALEVLEKAMYEHMFDVKLESGDFCFLDNCRVVHGRKPFKARHDGTDRWLKRLNLTSDIRKFKAARSAHGAQAASDFRVAH
jgi:Fe(II)/alpha-ketoglutarate-dependent arginine beta-hydroxylase